MKKNLTRNEWIILILGASLLFGILVRFFPGTRAGFPLNDGGMFLSMIRDLRTSHYVLPQFTSYNNANIPYAYPPFGFYLARIISDLFHVSEINLLRWLPPAVNSLSILAFYALTSTLLDSRRRGAVAAAFYALTPGAFGWFIMGGGLTRSFGALFMLLSLWQVYRLFRSGGRTDLILSILFCSLTVHSHPEVGIHTAAGCLLLWLFYGRTRRTAFYAVIVAAGTLLLSAPWWLTVISYHGLSPLLSALHTGSYGTPLWLALYSAIFVSESYIPILVILRVFGLAWGLWKRQYFLVAWFLLPYIVEPRSAPSIVFYPLCMLTALAVTDALPTAFDHFFRKDSTVPAVEFNERKWFNISLLLVMVYLFIDSGLYGFRLINNSLTTADRAAMDWVAQNTPLDSHFILITGVRSAEIDPFVEWFPALTDRRSQTTLQGFEWTLGSKFYERYTDLADVQSCDTAACIEDWSARTGLDYQYVVVQKSGVDKNLISSMNNASEYETICSTKDVAIYHFK